jgi:hypothetical protein
MLDMEELASMLNIIHTWLKKRVSHSALFLDKKCKEMHRSDLQSHQKHKTSAELISPINSSSTKSIYENVMILPLIFERDFDPFEKTASFYFTQKNVIRRT